nr:hypothetical protein [Tanacetum cinerariifolium]
MDEKNGRCGIMKEKDGIVSDWHGSVDKVRFLGVSLVPSTKTYGESDIRIQKLVSELELFGEKLSQEDFWSTAVAKTINGETQIHARVDGKKVIISEASIRRDLQFANEEGVDCLPNSTIFKHLASMGTVASAIIFLAINQKFNFSKWIFDSMGRNLDNLSRKLLMYPRNMRRIGKGFPRRITPLFSIMVQQKTHKTRKPKIKNNKVPQPSGSTKHVVDEAVYKELGDSLVRATTTASSLEVEQGSGNINKTQSKATPNESSSQGTNLGGGPKCQKAMGDTSSQTRVKKIKRRNKLRTPKLKRLYKVGLTTRIESSDNKESLGEDASKQERIEAIDDDEDITLDKGKGILVEKPVKPKKKDQIRLDEEANLKLQAEFDEEQRLARKKAEKELEANIALIGTWDDVQAKIDADQQLAERLKVEEQQELTDEEKATLFIGSSIDAIPMAIKSPRIVDWKIYKEGKKSYYQITKADGKSKMYMFFSQMLTSFDREDLVYLYKLVKAQYGLTWLVEDLDLLLWGDLTTMFEPHIEDAIWRKQQGYKVFEWKLYDSYGVHSLRI